jgi:hypothetical protein
MDQRRKLRHWIKIRWESCAKQFRDGVRRLWECPDRIAPEGRIFRCESDPLGGRLLCGPLHDALQSVRHVDALHRDLAAQRTNLTLFKPAHVPAPLQNRPDRRVVR